jgi:hypothetical protein
VTHPLNIMPVWLSASRHNSPLLHPFPKHLLPLLSNKPSVRTNAVAAALLNSAGVPVSQQLMRMSVCEAVAKLLEYPGAWLGGAEGTGSQGRGEGTRYASECLAKLVRARECVPRAWDARARAQALAMEVQEINRKGGKDDRGKGGKGGSDDDHDDDDDDDDDDLDAEEDEDAMAQTMAKFRRERMRHTRVEMQQAKVSKTRLAGMSICMCTYVYIWVYFYTST